MNEKVLRIMLTTLLEGGEAHVPAETALDKVKSSLRNVRPKENIHSVWENLEHMRIAQKDIIEYMLGPDWESPAWPEEYWPNPDEEVSDEVWNNSVNEFSEYLEKMVKIVNDPEFDLTAPLPHAPHHNYLRQAFLVADHNAYHTGQIIMVRKMLEDW
jgi:uncharacterized damage-inducible protein DinB